MATMPGILKRSTTFRQRASQISEPVLSAIEEDSTGIIEAGDFRIDLGSCLATVRGRHLRLSRAEFDVLLFLVSHPRRLVTSRTKPATKSEDVVREGDFVPALLSLRKKLLEEAPDAHYIQTEAWILYKFDPGHTKRN